MPEVDAGAAGAPTAARAAPRRRVWPWLPLGPAAVFVAAVVAGVLVLGSTLEQAPGLGGFGIRIDDQQVLALPRHEAAWWALAAAVAAAMVVLVVVPLSLLLALVLAVLSLTAAVVVLLAAAALMLSPLWGPALLLWLALRGPRGGGRSARNPPAVPRGTTNPPQGAPQQA